MRPPFFWSVFLIGAQKLCVGSINLKIVHRSVFELEARCLCETAKCAYHCLERPSSISPKAPRWLVEERALLVCA
jgi:hypothetical protein